MASPLVPLRRGEASAQIRYVVFITKENHTYDTIFDRIPGANHDPSLLLRFRGCEETEEEAPRPSVPEAPDGIDPWAARPLPPLGPARPLPVGAVLKRLGPSEIRVALNRRLFVALQNCSCKKYRLNLFSQRSVFARECRCVFAQHGQPLGARIGCDGAHVNICKSIA